MISRTDSKLKRVAEECALINPEIKTQTIAKDFTKNSNMAFYEKIREEVGDKDIGLLIANAGIYHPGRFWKIDAEVHESMLDCNIYHVTALLRTFLPQLKARKNE